MDDPTQPPIDWYPSALRPNEAQAYSLWDRYEATSMACDVPPDPHQRNAALRVLNGVSGLVYACRVDGGLIKVGYSERLDRRRNGLKGELLAVAFGSYDDEQALHARLVGHLHHGREWYYPTPGVLAVVNEMRATLGLEPVAA